MNEGTLYELIRQIVLKETIFQRIYAAEVKAIEDPLNAGRIKVLIPDLTWGDPSLPNSEFIDWARPRDKNGLLTPKIGDYVDVYFLGGRKEYLCYIGLASEVQASRVTSYAPGKQVIFEDRAAPANAIVFDEMISKFKIGLANEKYVKGDTFKTELDKIIALLGGIKTMLTSFVPTTWGPTDILLWTTLQATIAPLLNGSSATILSDKIVGE